MPILTKDEHKKIVWELNLRFSELQKLTQGKPLKSPNEGLTGRKRWSQPEQLVSTVGSKEEIALAFADIQSLKALLK